MSQWLYALFLSIHSTERTEQELLSACGKCVRHKYCRVKVRSVQDDLIAMTYEHRYVFFHCTQYLVNNNCAIGQNTQRLFAAALLQRH